MRVQVHLHSLVQNIFACMASVEWNQSDMLLVERTPHPTFDLISFWLRGRANEARNSLAKIEAACRNVCMAFWRQHVSILDQISFFLSLSFCTFLCVDRELLNTHTYKRLLAWTPQWNKLPVRGSVWAAPWPRIPFWHTLKKAPPIFYVLKYPWTFRSFAAAHNEQEIVSNAFFCENLQGWSRKRRRRRRRRQPRRTKMIAR